MSNDETLGEYLTGEELEHLHSRIDDLRMERDALREAGNALAEYLGQDPCPPDVGCHLCAQEVPLVAAWRSVAGEPDTEASNE